MSKINLYAGMTVNDARLMRLLSSGSTSEVWSAQTGSGETVVLKIYHGKEMQAQAEKEFTVAKTFGHENILMPVSFTACDGSPVIRLPYCRGRSVDGIAAHISEKMIWQLLLEAAKALDAVHSQGYGHFDVKPSNILWDGRRFLLTDFGACARTGTAATATCSATCQFDAPEFHSQLHTACDIWSLGATAFYLYMGCHVFNGLGGQAQHEESPVPYMRKSLPELSELVQRCLDFNPDKRPTAREITQLAQRELDRLGSTSPKRRLHQATANRDTKNTYQFWPDQMIEI